MITPTYLLHVINGTALSRG